MKVTLVRSPLTLSKYASAAPAVPPIGMAYVAASLLQAGHQVRAIDPIGEALDQYIPWADNVLYRGLTLQQTLDRLEPSDVFGISIMFSQDWPVARRLIQDIKARFPESVVIAGGEHVSAEPIGALEDALELDFVLPGEGDRVIIDFMEYMEGKCRVDEVSGIYYRDGSKIVSTAAAQRMKKLDGLLLPAWDLLPLENYLSGGHGWGVNRGRNMPIIASRGCPYQCTFCSNPQMWTTRWVARPPQEVLDEMKFYIKKYNVNNFDFQDLTAIVKKDWIVEFCKLLIAEELNITWQLPTGTRSEAIDQVSAPLLVAAGCRNITYAPESGSEVVLRRIKKKIKREKVLASARATYKAGANVKFNFIFGFPEDTIKDLLPSFVFIWKLAIIGVSDISIAPFSAYPGSELFRDLQAKGRIPKKLDDAYYSKIPFSDMSKTESWCEHISSTGLNRLRNIAMISFYLLSWTLRPIRPFRVIWNFMTAREESRMDKALADMWRRLAKARQGQPGLASGSVNPF